MTPQNFGVLILGQFTKCKDILSVKETEYSQGKDRLDQFKRGGEFRGKHPMDVLAGMMLKHTTSIYDLIERCSAGEHVSIEMWDEKITDHINYLLLLKGLVVDDSDGF